MNLVATATLFLITLILFPTITFSQTCTDVDGDGYAVEGGTCGDVDCNDGDENIYPGGSEVRIMDIQEYHLSIQSAYEAAFNGETIQAKDVALFENISINQNKSVIFDGGYDCSFSTNQEVTTIIGDMTISEGTLTINNGSVELLGDDPDAINEIMEIGDSIFEGRSASDCKGDRSYLYDLLNGEYVFVGSESSIGTNLDGDCFKNPDQVLVPEYDYNCGFYGKRTDQIEALLPDCISYMSQGGTGSRIALIHAGTNDVSQLDLTDGPILAAVIQNLKDVVDIVVAYDSNILIYVAQPIPRNDVSDAENDLLVAEIAKATPAGLSGYSGVTGIVDQNTNYISCWGGWDTASTVHPDDVGYECMAWEWATAIYADLP